MWQSLINQYIITIWEAQSEFNESQNFATMQVRFQNKMIRWNKMQLVHISSCRKNINKVHSKRRVSLTNDRPVSLTNDVMIKMSSNNSPKWCKNGGNKSYVHDVSNLWFQFFVVPENRNTRPGRDVGSCQSLESYCFKELLMIFAQFLQIYIWKAVICFIPLE